MGRRIRHIDPYLLMMKRLGRRAYAYSFMALLALATAFFAASEDSDGAYLLTPALEHVRYMIALFFLFAGIGLGARSLWFGIQYWYFGRWPERFQEGDDL